MADDAPAPGSPEWWLRRLHARLVARRPSLEGLAAYYDGQHPLAFSSKKFREAFGGLFHAFADNWCGVVVGATEERLNVTGFRVDSEPKSDQDAWRIWQRNDMDLQAQMGHVEALYAGVTNATVWVDADGLAEITVDSSMGTIVETHPKRRRQRLAALRTYCDEQGYEHAELFLPDAVWLFVSARPNDSGITMPEQMTWLPDTHVDGTDGTGHMANPLGVVPVVPIDNKPRLWTSKGAAWGSASELGAIIPLQNVCNKLMADMIVAAEFGAFPQRYAIGYDDENGDAATKFRSGPGNFWWLEDAEGKLGQFEATDLNNYVQAVELTVQHVASISATPPHYLRASADRLSGESLKSAETGLVAKVRRRQLAFSDPWETVMRLAGKLEGVDTLTNATSMETLWSDPESRTESEHVDATLKKQALGVPRQQLWEDLGYSPQQIERFKAMEMEDGLLGLTAPPPPPLNPFIPGLPARNAQQ